MRKSFEKSSKIMEVTIHSLTMCYLSCVVLYWGYSENNTWLQAKSGENYSDHCLPGIWMIWGDYLERCRQAFSGSQGSGVKSPSPNLERYWSTSYINEHYCNWQCLQLIGNLMERDRALWSSLETMIFSPGLPWDLFQDQSNLSYFKSMCKK